MFCSSLSVLLQVMRSLQKVWARTRARNTLFPKEMLFFEFNSYFVCFICSPTLFCLFPKFWLKLRSMGTRIRLWLQSDNTVKEIRNQYGCRTLAALTQAGIFQSSCEAHLRVGHTHEDVDGIFSLVTAALKTAPASSVQTPMDIRRLVDEKLGPLFHSKDQAWGIEIVEAVS